MNWQSDSIKDEILKIVIEHYMKLDELDEKLDRQEISKRGWQSQRGRVKNAMRESLLNLRVRCTGQPTAGLMRVGVPVMRRRPTTTSDVEG